jgi:arginase family enzyme
MARIALIGLPSDANSSFLRGPAKAPALIRAQLFSPHGNSAAENGFELGDEILIDDLGDLPLANTAQSTADDDVLITTAVAAALVAGQKPLLLGGDHAVTYPVVKALAAHHGALTILHIDAHPDLYDELGGNRRSHASPFARIMEDALAKRLVQIGIRTMNHHQHEQAARFRVESVAMAGFTPAQVPRLDGPLYISVDLDGLDPGGLSVRQLLDIFALIDVPVVGADVVEYNPDRDVHDMTAVVAAKLVKELAALLSR